MPFDGLEVQYHQRFNRHRLATVCRRAAHALARFWQQGPVARRFEDRCLQRSLEAAAVPELLCAARGLILSEEKWVQGRLRIGDEKFCAMGAILQVSALGARRRVTHSSIIHLQAVAKRRGFSSIEKMNDSSTHAEVLTAFDEAIRLSEARCSQATALL